MRTELSQNKYSAKRPQIILLQRLSEVWFSGQQCNHHLETSQTQFHPDESKEQTLQGQAQQCSVLIDTVGGSDKHRSQMVTLLIL